MTDNFEMAIAGLSIWLMLALLLGFIRFMAWCWGTTTLKMLVVFTSLWAIFTYWLLHS
jgi:hypothetical protein